MMDKHFAQLNSYWTRFKSFFRFFGKICINKIFRIDSQIFSFHLLGSKKYSGGKIFVNTATDMMEIKPNIHIRSTMQQHKEQVVFKSTGLLPNRLTEDTSIVHCLFLD